MPRPTKGARLYLRKARRDARSGRRLADVWFIRDGDKQVSTGCAADELREAERQLALYISQKQRAEPSERERLSDPKAVIIAEVVELYALERAPKAADPVATRARLENVLRFWGGRPLADVNRSNCDAYVAWRCVQPIQSFKNPATARRVTPAGARRELEDLSAAIGYWDDEHHLSRVPKVILPAKPASPRDALSRAEAAALLWAAMGWRKDADGRWRRLQRSVAANRRHLRRFILIGLYTGTRPGVLPQLLWRRSETSAWIDLDRGWVFRRGNSEADTPTKRRPLARLPKRLLAHLRRWRRLDEEANADRARRGLLPLEHVLHHGGRPIESKIRKSYASAVRDARLNPRITPHWHRHTAATWLMEANVPGHRAAQYLGMTVTTLEKHYGHHRPDFQNDVAAAIGRGGRAGG